MKNTEKDTSGAVLTAFYLIRENTHDDVQTYFHDWKMIHKCIHALLILTLLPADDLAFEIVLKYDWKRAQPCFVPHLSSHMPKQTGN